MSLGRELASTVNDSYLELYLIYACCWLGWRWNWQQICFHFQPQPERSAMTDEIWSECCSSTKLTLNKTCYRGDKVTSVGLIGGRLQTFLATLWHDPGPKWSFWVYRPDVEARSALCLPVLPQMIWQGQHWSQHLRMPGLLTLCTPLSWLQASLMQPSLTQQLLLLLQPCTPRWGTNRCVYLLPSLLFSPPGASRGHW